ncbi:MAG: T9SS type A sorting domain-containing protein, partial [Bacteroidia bacterium]|nr:T9SS type A sorting domain-containing protein [Bacteroidia bacterium]
ASTYTWAPPTGLSAITGSSVTANPTVTTTYTVTGTTGSCSSTQTVTITVNPTPTVTVSPSPAIICSGDSISLTATGATNYTWSPATGLNAITGATVKASPLATTSYTVTGSNGSCTSTAVVLVTVKATPRITVTPSSATICATGPGVTLTASGAASYAWSPPGGLSNISVPVVTASPTVTTTYTVTGTSEGCSGSAIVTITVDNSVEAAISGKDTICAGDSTTLTASGGGNYTWSTGSTASIINVKPPSTEQYKVIVRQGDCSDTATVLVVVITTCDEGINELSFNDNIVLFPNPTTGNVQVQCDIPDGEYTMNLTNVLGQILYANRLSIHGKYSYFLNLSNYSSGLYILTINGVNSTTHKKIILNK